MENKRLLIIIGVIIVGFGGLVALTKLNATETKSNGSDNLYGKLDSPVQLTEFVDFQCEACYAFYPTVKAVKEKYKDQVKFQVKNFPISSAHANSLAAAASAQAAAKQGKFWEMHNLLFERQKMWENDTNRDEVFASFANELSLNPDQFKSDVASSETRATINADLDEVKRLGGDGTPTFVLNGKKIDNPENSIEAFSAMLDKELEKVPKN
ncbi:MAG TPA: thioredoxin domain-containing protein [Candidatus Saccharimonadales bacterium]|nr:thioredoxin domain-containing protein [Candidatus Saccharimonadales bacterium]